MGTQNKADWNKAYRITLIEDQTHKRLRAFRFTKAVAIVGIITAAVVLFGSFYLIMAFTPLRTTIPGYPDEYSKRTAISNAIRIDSLESVITRWQLYSDNLSRVLAGEETLSIDSLVKGNTTRYLRAKSAEELKVRDSLLRAQVASEEQFGVSDRARRNLPIEGKHFFVPLKGVVSQGFDRTLHPAIDISAPQGSVISSILDGTVIWAGWDDATGYCIAVQHESDIVSIYKHNRKLLRSAGDKIAAGETIALVGSSGTTSTGAHLHLEIWSKGEAVDPARFINF